MNLMPDRPARGRRPFTAIALAVVTGLIAFVAPIVSSSPAHAETDPLTQKIDPNQAQGVGQVVLDSGHVDFGPTLSTGEWAIQLHDDTGVPKFWRHLEDVVLQVKDTAIRQVPDGEEYSFLGEEPGTDVWIVPQVQAPGVIWAGWNTQEPMVLDSLSRGTTLRVLGVDGPGQVSVFLQTGNFGQTTQLWSSLKPFPQESWIEVNTHTHANWVFGKAGIYLIEIEFRGDLVNGESVTARDTLRFSVGDETDPQQAFGATFDSAQLADDEGANQGPPPAEPAAPGADMSILIWTIVGAVLAVLIVALSIVVMATRNAKARARAARDSRGVDG